MSFSFNFSNNDIDLDSDSAEHQQSTSATQQMTAQLSTTTISTPSQPLIPPQKHSFSSLLTDLPSQISYNYLTIPCHHSLSDVSRSGASAKAQNIRIPRRSVFDIRTQLMAEADVTDTSGSDADSSILISGLDKGDLSSGIYEGGFKTWECAVDLASYLSSHLISSTSSSSIPGTDPVVNVSPFSTRGERVIELGAGSAIPSLVVLQHAFSRRYARHLNEGSYKEDWEEMRFVLCDYNLEVLKLGTAINALLVILFAKERLEKEAETGDDEDEDQDGKAERLVRHEEDELELDTAMVERTLDLLDNLNIQLDFVSGAWGQQFIELVGKGSAEVGGLTLASETIYNLESLPSFVAAILELSQNDGTGALVGAKNVYFGVGGGIEEFRTELTKQDGTASMVDEVRGAGVARAIWQVRPLAPPARDSHPE